MKLIQSKMKEVMLNDNLEGKMIEEVKQHISVLHQKEIKAIETKICMKCKQDEKVNVEPEEVNDVLMEMIHRVFNALYGQKVDSYRSENLRRINTVAFRTQLAVKSERKY